MFIKLICLTLLGLVLLEACASAAGLEFLGRLGPYPLTAAAKSDTFYGKLVGLSRDILGPMITELILSIFEIPSNIYNYFFEKEHKN